MSQQDSHSRRSLLTAATAAVGAIGAWAIGRPTPARAEGEAVLVGGEYTTATSVTKIQSSADIVVVHAHHSGSGANGVGLRAHSSGGTGLQATSGNFIPLGRADTAIYGFHNGATLGKMPVVARFEAQQQSSMFATATALQVVGSSQFSRSGVAVVPAGQIQVVVPVSQITANSFTLATLQQVRSGVYVAAVSHQVAASTITIRLNMAPSVNTRVGWFVLERPPVE